MKRRQKAAWFLSGLVASVLLSATFLPAMAAAATQTISVITGVNVYVDDKQIDAGDLNGNPDAFIYNGTTYVAAAAVSKSLGQTVQWDGKTSSVYIGRHDGSEPAVWLADLDYFSGTKNLSFKTSERDNLGDTHYHCITTNFDRFYKLNGNYSKLTGTLYQKYDYRSSQIPKGSRLEIYGDGKLLYNYEFFETTAGFEPVNFSVDLTGVLELEVLFEYGSTYGLTLFSLGDCGLWT